MVAKRFETGFSLPDKLQRRERIMRENERDEYTAPAQTTSSFIIGKDGSLTPVYDPELLEIIEQNTIPDNG